MVAAAELGEFLNRAQPLSCGIAETRVTGVEEPGVGLNATAAHTTAQLIQLSQAEAVGVLDQDRVDPGDVQAAFDDGGAEHHVGLTGVEGDHGAFQFAFGHLAMGHKQFQIGKHRPQPRGHVLDALHPWNHVEHLTAAIEFLTDRTANGFRIQGCQVGLDRSPQWRRGGDQAHLPNAGQAHVKGSGNRRR